MELKADMCRLWPGGTLYGVRCQQSWSGIYLLERMLHSGSYASVVEYGSGHGALSLFLCCWAAQHGLAFQTVERYQAKLACDGGVTDTKALLARLGCVVSDLDCQAQATADAMAALTKAPRLWVIDNGNKPVEAALVAQVADASDVMLLHDYGTEVGDKSAPPGWAKWGPWQAEADDIEAKYLVLKKEHASG